MNCPACARPVALARPTCMYCGAALSEDARQEAASAAKRVLDSRSFVGLGTAATGPGSASANRRYIVVDVSIENPAETIARACGVSLWEARQWQAASRYRLFRITDEPPGGATEAAIRSNGLRCFVIPEDAVARSRSPILLKSILVSTDSVLCTLRQDERAPPVRKSFGRDDVALIVSGAIRRERVRERGSRKGPVDIRLEETWLVHFHLNRDERPWEIDPRYTAFEGDGLASAHMRTLDLVRSLSPTAPLDEAFKNVVPALSPAVDPSDEMPALQRDPKASKKEPKVVVLDNAAQFKEYSAWRGRVEVMRLRNPSGWPD